MIAYRIDLRCLQLAPQSASLQLSPVSLVATRRLSVVSGTGPQSTQHQRISANTVTQTGPGPTVVALLETAQAQYANETRTRTEYSRTLIDRVDDALNAQPPPQHFRVFDIMGPISKAAACGGIISFGSGDQEKRACAKRFDVSTLRECGTI